MNTLIKIILHTILTLIIIRQLYRNSKGRIKNTPQLSEKQNITMVDQKIEKYKNQQTLILKLTHLDKVQVEIQNQQIFHLDPQILIDEVKFQQTMNGDKYKIHESESIVLKFKTPQQANLFQFNVRVNQLNEQNIYKSEIDDFQVRRIRIFGIYRNKEFLLINKALFRKNDTDISFKLSNSRKFLKVTIVCKNPLCENQYRIFRIQLISPTEYVHVYPITLYNMNNVDTQFWNILM